MSADECRKVGLTIQVCTGSFLRKSDKVQIGCVVTGTVQLVCVRLGQRSEAPKTGFVVSRLIII